MIVFDNIFSCSFVPAVGIFLSDEGLVDISRFVRITLLSSINRHGNQSCPVVDVCLVVDYRLVEEVGFDIEHRGAAVKSKVECRSPIRRRVGERTVQRLAVCQDNVSRFTD